MQKEYGVNQSAGLDRIRIGGGGEMTQLNCGESQVFSTHRSLRALLRLAIAVFAGVGAAHAQQPTNANGQAVTAPATQDQASSLQEVVVTGTLLKNAAPVGSTLVTLDQDRKSTRLNSS